MLIGLSKNTLSGETQRFLRCYFAIFLSFVFLFRWLWRRDANARHFQLCWNLFHRSHLCIHTPAIPRRRCRRLIASSPRTHDSCVAGIIYAARRQANGINFSTGFHIHTHKWYACAHAYVPHDRVVDSYVLCVCARRHIFQYIKLSKKKYNNNNNNENDIEHISHAYTHTRNNHNIARSKEKPERKVEHTRHRHRPEQEMWKPKKKILRSRTGRTQMGEEKKTADFLSIAHFSFMAFTNWHKYTQSTGWLLVVKWARTRASFQNNSIYTWSLAANQQKKKKWMRTKTFNGNGKIKENEQATNRKKYCDLWDVEQSRWR